MKATFLEAARSDLREGIRYYESQRRGLGAEFRKEVLAALDRIKSHPDAWQPLGDQVRRCLARRFPYA